MEGDLQVNATDLGELLGYSAPSRPWYWEGVSFVSAIHCHDLESFLTLTPCWWLWEIC